MTKYERQGAILRLVEQNQLSTQAEVTEALRGQGFDAVQATVSRDISAPTTSSGSRVSPPLCAAGSAV